MILILALLAGCSEYALHQAPDPVHPQDAPIEPGDPDDPIHGPPVEASPPVGAPPLDPPEPPEPVDPWAPLDEPSDVPLEPHVPLEGGHFDVETTSFLAPLWEGSVDGHVHQYDERFEVGGIDYFDVLHGDLRAIDEVITDPHMPFKLIVANPALSPGGRLVINRTYNAADPTTWHPVEDYAAIPLAELPVFTLSGIGETYPLQQLGLYFDQYAIVDGDLIPSSTECVVENIPGVHGAWRNGAITVQAVRTTNSGAVPLTDLELSVGGVHGVATAGLLYEGTLFWHWKGPCSHEESWEDHEEPSGGGGGGGPHH